MTKMIKKIFSCLLIVFIFVVFIGGTIAWQSYRFWFQSPSKETQEITFVVDDGESFSQISKNLNLEEIISSKFWFRVFGKIDGSARSIQAGTFKLKPKMSYSTIVDELINAQSEETTITIPEGYTLEQIGELIEKNFDVTKEEFAFLTGMGSPFETHPFIVAAQKPDNVDLEGYLFPDTYRFFKDASAEDIIQKMLDTMQSKVDGLKDDLPEGYTIHNVITLASVVEREVMGIDDKSLVADLFLRRLEIGMPLQADSTVNYITGKNTPSINLVDRDIKSPYNTYQNAGLPPGPISNPGFESIKAVLEPTPNSFLFFLTTKEGKVIYSDNFNAHVKAKNLYLR